MNLILNSVPSGETRCFLAGTNTGQISTDNYQYPVLYTNDGGKNWSNNLIIINGNVSFTGGVFMIIVLPFYPQHEHFITFPPIISQVQ